MGRKVFVVLSLLFAGLCACGEVVPPEGTSTSMATLNSVTLTTTAEEITADMTRPSATTAEIKPYFEVIKSKIKMYDAYPEQLIDQSYVLYDIDDNGTKEVLLGKEFRGYISLVAIYVIKDGVVVWQEKFMADPESGGPPPFVYKNGIIRVHSYDTDDYKNYYYYHLTDGELKFQTLLCDHIDGYFCNNEYGSGSRGNSITKEEFERLQKEFEGDGQVVELDWKPLAEYGR